MSKDKRNDSFWLSYSDLMTSLFFIMLVLFILSIALFKGAVVKNGKDLKLITEQRDATKAEIDKINEIRNAIQSIDSTYFTYDPQYKKHILKTRVKFQKGSADINDLDSSTQVELLTVRDRIRAFLTKLMKKDPEISYLLIIEGQASRDGYMFNNQLSYDRALSLFRLWFPDQNSTSLKFYDLPCEVVIAGAGCMEGKPRSEDNAENQRFLIQIIPKPGLIPNQ